MKHVQVGENQSVVTVTLNRPERHNAFHPEMIAELTKIFLELEQRSDVRAVILRGAGKSFSAGGDLEWMRSMVDYSHAENLADAGRLFAMFEAMALCSHPVIGHVHGHIMGGGLGLVAVCDIVAAETGAQFSFSEARIGIAPAVISPFVLRKVTQGAARPYMLTAKVFASEEAKELGLVHFVGESEAAQGFVSATVQQFLACAPEAVREAKRLMNFIAAQPWSLLRERAVQVIAERRASSEGQEGLKAFLEKRRPRWAGSQP